MHPSPMLFNTTTFFTLSQLCAYVLCVLWVQVSTDEARAYAESESLMFMETSAKTAQNVEELFYSLGN